MVNAVPLKTLEELKHSAAQLLVNDEFEPQLLAKVLQKLVSVSAELAQVAADEPAALNALTELNSWYSVMMQQVSNHRAAVGATIKELNTGRKASHNYRMNK